MPRKFSAQRGHLTILGAIALLIFAGLFAAACGDDDDDGGDTSQTPTSTPTSPVTETPTEDEQTPTPTQDPGDGTTTPTPQTNDPQGLEDALSDFEDELRSGGLDAIVARLLIEEYTCKADDLEPGLGQPECTTAGEVIRALLMSSWRSEGGLRKVETVVAFLQALDGDIAADQSDDYGSGEPTFYAFDSSVERAVLTMIVACQPQHQCANGYQRVAMVFDLEYEDGRWMVEKIMNAFVLYEDFLEPTAEGSNYFPEWERLN